MSREIRVIHILGEESNLLQQTGSGHSVSGIKCKNMEVFVVCHWLNYVDYFRISVIVSRHRRHRRCTATGSCPADKVAKDYGG